MKKIDKKQKKLLFIAGVILLFVVMSQQYSLFTLLYGGAEETISNLSKLFMWVAIGIIAIVILQVANLFKKR